MKIRIESHVVGRKSPIQVVFPDSGFDSVFDLRLCIAKRYGERIVTNIASGVEIRPEGNGMVERIVVTLEAG